VPTQPSTFVDLVKSAVLRRDPEYCAYPPSACFEPTGPPCDFILTGPEDNPQPDELFPHLRWGGQVVYASPRKADVQEITQRFVDREYIVSRGPARVGRGWFGLSLPFTGPSTYYVMLRKVLLTLPREISERFTYSLRLVKAPDGTWIVQKEVPTTERVTARLKKKFPEMDDAYLASRARKFTEKIFPLFLTREAAMLKILQKHLPPEYAKRMPKLLHLEKDDRGMVRRLWMNWLRNGGEPLDQMTFARQSSDLLRALHDLAEVIHLDLRPDNMVITKDGVGFIDFGSAVRVDEDLTKNPLLKTLMDDLMRTSEIQKTMGRMRDSGLLTSPVIEKGFQKVDKSVDLFYLALQLREPLGNPDLRGLVNVNPGSSEAAALGQITEEVLRPKNPDRPTYASAKDLLAGVNRVPE